MIRSYGKHQHVARHLLVQQKFIIASAVHKLLSSKWPPVRSKPLQSPNSGATYIRSRAACPLSIIKRSTHLLAVLLSFIPLQSGEALEPMGCKQSKSATLVHRTSSIAMPLQPSTPSFHAHNTKLWAPTSGSQTNESREELPSFVVSDSADLVGSSDGEPVHGMVSAFTFSFIQVSETSSTHSSLGDSLFTSVEQTSPGPPESLTFAMIGDPLELTAIPEERPEFRDSVKALTSTAQQESAALIPSAGGMTEAGDETLPPPTLATHVNESSAENGSAMIESSELLIHELDISSVGHRSEDSSHNAIDTRRSETLSELSDESEYMATEMGALVRKKSLVEHVSFLDESSYNSFECQSIEEIAAAIVQEIIDIVLSNTTEAPIEEDRRQLRDCGTLAARSSLQVEPSSASLTCLDMKTQQSKKAQLLSFRAPIYAIVDTSTDNGVVMYHVQLSTLR